MCGNPLNLFTSLFQKSGILRSPAPIPFIYPDSQVNDDNLDQQDKSHPDSAHSSKHMENTEEEKAVDATQGERLSNMQTEADPVRLDYNSPDRKQPVQSPCTPEVIVNRRPQLSAQRSISIFSDSSSPGRPGKNDNYADDDIPTSCSMGEEEWSPKGASTPICSAMELFLNAEPFVPNLNNLENSAFSEAVEAWRHCETPLKIPVQETTDDNCEGTSGIDQGVSENNKSNIEDAPGVTGPTSHAAGPKQVVDKTETKCEMMQYPIPVIEHGIVRERNGVVNENTVVDVKPTQSWMVSSSDKVKTKDKEPAASECQQHEHQQVHPQGSQKTTTAPKGFIRPLMEIQLNNDHRQQMMPQPQGLAAAGFVLLPTQIHQQQQQQLQQLGAAQHQVAGVSGFPIQQQNTRPIQHQQPQFIQNNHQAGALVLQSLGLQSAGVAGHQQWHQPQQQQQQQQQFRDFLSTGPQQQQQFQNNQAWATQQMHAMPPLQHVQQQQVQQQQYQGQLQNLQQQQFMQQQQQQAAYRQQQQQQQQQLLNAPGNRGLLGDAPSPRGLLGDAPDPSRGLLGDL